MAAENFLSVNNLPAHYLDEVAQFIIKNAGEYHGSTSAMAADPFTGNCIHTVVLHTGPVFSLAYLKDIASLSLHNIGVEPMALLWTLPPPKIYQFWQTNIV